MGHVTFCMARPWTDEEKLRELYIDKDLTYQQIADRFDCSVSTVKNWSLKYGINEETKKWKDKDLMYHLYIEEDMSQQEVADEIGCAFATVNRWIDRHNIPIKSHGGKLDGPTPSKREANTEICERCGEEFKIPPNKAGKSVQCYKCRQKHGHLESRNQKLKEVEHTWHDEEMGNNVSRNRTGMSLTEEHKKNIGLANQGEKNSMYGKYGKDHPGYGNKGHEKIGEVYVEETGHKVKSEWEAEVDRILYRSEIDYEYEPKQFKFKDFTYTPDFIVNGNIVIEVKGLVREHDIERSELFMFNEPLKTYIVMGNNKSQLTDYKIPCDEYLEWNERDKLIDVINQYE